MQLSTEQCDRFWEDGWITLRGVIPMEKLPTLQRLVTEAETTMDRQRPGRQGDDDKAYSALDVTKNPHLHYPELQALAEALADIPRQLLDVPAVRLFHDVLFTKPPAQGADDATAWHQDFPSLPLDSARCLTVWVAVDDIPLEGSPLRFLAGSHRVGPLIAGTEGSDPRDVLTVRERGLVGDVQTEPLRAGDATVHHCLTLHGAPPNMSDRTRRAWSIEYFSADALYTGLPHVNVEGAGIKLPLWQPFDHPRFPILARN